MTSPVLSLLTCLTMAATFEACSSSSHGSAVTDAQASPDADPCSLNGSFHITFAPAAGSPAECACSTCSYDVAGGHVTDSLSLASANAQYFLQPLLVPDGGLPPDFSCDSNETSTCTFEGDCLSHFTFTVANGAASGTQSFAFNGGADGGTLETCTYDVTASPCAPSGPNVCRF